MSEHIGYIIKILSDKFGLEAEEIKPSSFFEDDLNIGEMELIDVLTDLEEELQTDLLEERENIDTVQDLLDIIEERIG
jgi:acyl carrier protein